MKDDPRDSCEAEHLDVYTVTEISEAIRQHLESEFPRVSVLGETANFKAHTSGHWYFTLRDGSAMIHAVLFRRYAETISFTPEDGMMVVASGRLSHFGAQGRTELLAVDIVPAGRGVLEIEFRKLLEKLMREGLTSPRRKRPLPPYPERIAVITSPTGAVIRDISDTLARRWPVAEVVYVAADVQGPGAAGSIARAFERTNGMAAVDVVILARGGGSVEDLWAFNLEEVARAVAGSIHPVVTGIGHEIDTTVVDHVADVRAATPTAAAELATPLAEEVARRCAGLVDTLGSLARGALENNRHLVRYLVRSSAFPALVHRLERGALDLESRVTSIGGWWESARADGERLVESSLGRFEWLVGRNRDRARSELAARRAGLLEKNPAFAVTAMRGTAGHLRSVVKLQLAGMLSLRREGAAGTIRALESLDPRRVLKRGYAVCTDPAEGAVIARSRNVEVGGRLMVNFYDGGALCAVERKGGGTPWRKRRASRSR